MNYGLMNGFIRCPHDIILIGLLLLSFFINVGESLCALFAVLFKNACALKKLKAGGVPRLIRDRDGVFGRCFMRTMAALIHVDAVTLDLATETYKLTICILNLYK